MTGGGAPRRRWQRARKAFSAAAEVILYGDRSLYIPRGSGGAEKKIAIFLPRGRNCGFFVESIIQNI